MPIEKKIIKILAENFSEDTNIEQIGLDDDLKTLGINSITFIKVIVLIESEFGVVFEDENLDFNKFPNLRSIIGYLSKRLDIKN